MDIEEYNKARQRATFGWYNQRLKWALNFITESPPTTRNLISSNPEAHKDIIIESSTSPDAYWYNVVYPLIAAGACLFLIVAGTIVYLVARKRKKIDDEECSGQSILVYPNKGSSGPQFLTKEIRFSVPPIRSSSLGDLDEECVQRENHSVHDTDSLLPITTSYAQRSNSFSCGGYGALDPALYASTPELEIAWPDGHLGRLWFSLRYEPPTEKLLVTLLKVRNLPSRTVTTVNSCDPFVRLHLLPDERRYLQTKQKKKTCNPNFDETFVFQVHMKDMSNHILKFTVIDSGRTKRRSVIGHSTFPLRDLDISCNEEEVFKKDLEKEAIELIYDLGELLISLVYNENLSRLGVTVIEAKRLKNRNHSVGSTNNVGFDAFVRVTLQQQYRAVKTKKTVTARVSDYEDGGIASFSECFNFRVPPARQDLTSLSFHIYQANCGYGRDKLIGKCVLGSYMFARGKALTHWNSAFANPMEQIQHWHALSE